MDLKTLAPADLLTRLGRTTTTPFLDGLLIQAALHLDGLYETPEQLATVLLDKTTTDNFLGPWRTMPILLSVVMRGDGDHLAGWLETLTQVAADITCDKEQNHDGIRCAWRPEDGCPHCDGILRDRLDEALGFLKSLLYGRALGDLASAAVAA